MGRIHGGFLGFDHARCFGGQQSVTSLDGLIHFLAERQPRQDFHSCLEAQLVEDMQVLRLGHRDQQLRSFLAYRQGAAPPRHRSGYESQDLRVDLDGRAIEVRNLRHLRQRRSKVALRNQVALQEQLSQMNELPLLVLKGLVQFGSGDMTALSEDFPQPLSLHFALALSPVFLPSSEEFSRTRGVTYFYSTHKTPRASFSIRSLPFQQ